MDGTHREKIDLAAIRARLAAARGPEYWRSLEELAESERFQEFLHNEFPRQASALHGPVNRREFLALMGASFALAGLSGCSATVPEKIVPYVRPPEEVVPGKPLFFATAMPMAGYATGLIAESNMGRPTKVEGNPDHPASLGTADVFAQASVLTLYDPDRSQVVTTAGRISTWESFVNVLTTELDGKRSTKGAGLRVLSETVTSPTLAWQLDRLLKEFPLAKWHQYEPIGRDNARAGSRLAFGTYVDVQRRFDRADVIVSFDSDFLSWDAARLRYAREFAARRKAQPGQNRMNRLYVVESTPSITGAMADHRFPLPAREIEGLAYIIGQRLGVRGVPQAGSAPQAAPPWLDALIRDFQSHRGSSLALAGDQQPAALHALTHAINEALGNAGKTVVYLDPVEASPAEHIESLRELSRDIDAGLVDVLIIIGGNPAFTAPADLQFSNRLAQVRLRVHLSLYEDETSELCHWHIPETHYLESWGDVRAYDGTATIIQPLINPLYAGKSAYELLSVFFGQPARPAYEILRDYWKERLGEDFEASWRRAVHDGIVAGTAAPIRSVALVPDFEIAQPAVRSPSGSQPALEVVFRPDPT
ncbi:MAG: molybdopterin oxidoreductase, partial [Acidobacteria bacterium]